MRCPNCFGVGYLVEVTRQHRMCEFCWGRTTVCDSCRGSGRKIISEASHMKSCEWVRCEECDGKGDEK